MHRITLTIILLLSATCADAAWYQKTDGTIVDPIQSVEGGDLPYSGNNLEPGADLPYADLYYADLINADLSEAWLDNAYMGYADLSDANLYDADLEGADLTGADLGEAFLSSADLSGADLSGADLVGADLTDADLRYAALHGADLTGADLSGSNFSNVYHYYNSTWTDAFYYTDNEPTWHSGMDAAWRTSAGILALAPTIAVPEPSTLLLALLGLALVPLRRRR